MQKKNKENEIKDLVKNLCNVFDFNIIGLYNNILDDQFENIKSINNFVKTTLTCEGTARWDWETCSTTFNITSLKFKANENDADGIEILTTDTDAGEKILINIKKPYVEGSTYNDIQESDILVNLLQQNSKLFYEYDGTKYVFNKVDLSKMIYHVFVSKFVSTGYSNYMYCLKCALNNKKSYNYLGWYGTGNYYINDSWLDDCDNCTANTNQYDTLDYYNIQINFLNGQAGDNHHNRIIESYSHIEAQKLCTKENLTNGWEKKRAAQ